MRRMPIGMLKFYLNSTSDRKKRSQEEAIAIQPLQSSQDLSYRQWLPPKLATAQEKAGKRPSQASQATARRRDAVTDGLPCGRRLLRPPAIACLSTIYDPILLRSPPPANWPAIASDASSCDASCDASPAVACDVACACTAPSSPPATCDACDRLRRLRSPASVGLLPFSRKVFRERLPFSIPQSHIELSLSLSLSLSLAILRSPAIASCLLGAIEPFSFFRFLV